MLEHAKQWAREAKRDLIALWFAKNHPDMPLMAKVVAMLVVAYAFSPIDLIPDFIPILGYVDDLILVPLGIIIAVRMIPSHVLDQARCDADAWLGSNQRRPKNWLAAALILTFWFVGAIAVWRYFAS